MHPDDLVRVARATEESIERQTPLSHPLPGAPRRGRLALVDGRGDRRPRRRRRAALPPGRAARRHRRGAGHPRARARPSSASGRWSSSCRWRSTSTSPTTTFTNVYISPQIERMLGYPVEQWMGNPRDVPGGAAPRGPRAGAGRAARVARAGAASTAASTGWSRGTATTSGSARSRSWSPATTGRRMYTQGYLEDVTERRAAERDLATSERRLRMVTDNMNDVIFLYGMDRKLRYVTPSFEDADRLHGGGAVRAQLPERRPPRRRAPGCCRCGGRVFEGESYTGAEFRIINRDGREKWCWSAGSPVHDAAGAADRRADPRRRHHAPASAPSCGCAPARSARG